MKNQLINSIVSLAILALFLTSCSSTKLAKTPNYIGTWVYSIDTPQGTTEGYLTIKKEDKETIGLVGSDMGETPLSDFEVSEETVSGSFDFQGYTVGLSGKFMNDTLDGLMSVGGYELPFVATKKAE